MENLAIEQQIGQKSIGHSSFSALVVNYSVPSGLGVTRWTIKKYSPCSKTGMLTNRGEEKLLLTGSDLEGRRLVLLGVHQLLEFTRPSRRGFPFASMAL